MIVTYYSSQDAGLKQQQQQQYTHTTDRVALLVITIVLESWKCNTTGCC